MTTITTHRHHITGEAAPVRVLRGQYYNGEVVTEADEPLYYHMDATGEAGLYRRYVATDYGGNQLRERTAPADTDGIGAPIRGTPLQTGPRDLVFWVR